MSLSSKEPRPKASPKARSTKPATKTPARRSRAPAPAEIWTVEATLQTLLASETPESIAEATGNRAGGDINLMSTPARKIAEGLVAGLIVGKCWPEVLQATGATWLAVQGLKARYPALRVALGKAERFGELLRREARRQAAHQRAVDGVRTPVYNNLGEPVGEKIVYSDRLMEVLLKMDNPQAGDSTVTHEIGPKAQSAIKGLMDSVAALGRHQPRPAIDVQVSGPIPATKPQPNGGEA